jgi:hypothetical protein
MKQDTRPLGQYDYEGIKSVIDGVDEQARIMEARWGVGRLDLLVDDETRVKFRRQLSRFNEAIEAHDFERIKAAGAAMRRAWVALDEIATRNGSQHLSPECWEIAMPNGRVIALCRTNADAFAEVRSGRHVEVWTVEEIARVIVNFPEVAKAKEVWPGALVESARAKAPPAAGLFDEFEDSEFAG